MCGNEYGSHGFVGNTPPLGESPDSDLEISIMKRHRLNSGDHLALLQRRLLSYRDLR